MDHLTQPIEALKAEAAYFARRERLRVFCVSVDDVLRDATLDTLAAIEWQPAPRFHVLLLQEAAPSTIPRWSQWAQALSAEYARVREAYAKAGIPLANVEVAIEREEPILDFARLLQRIVDGLTDPPAAADGVIVVLGPPQPPDADGFAREFANLAAVPQLARAKFVWLQSSEADRASAALVRHLGQDRVLAYEVHIDPEQQKHDLDELLDSLVAEEQDDSAGPWKARAPGEAWPDSAPPSHPGDPPPSASVRPLERSLIGSAPRARSSETRGHAHEPPAGS